MDETLINSTGRDQEIIEVAQKIFSEYGYKKVTMDDVAAKMNITRSALYYYYKSKEDLFVAVGEYDFRNYSLELKQAIESAQTVDDCFTAFCRNFLPMRKKFKDVYKLGNDDFHFSLGTHKKFRDLVTEIHSTLITEIFLKDKKLAKIDNLRYYATLLTYSIRGVLFSFFDASIDQLEHEIITLCRIFCQGLPGVNSAVKNDSDKKDK